MITRRLLVALLLALSAAVATAAPSSANDPAVIADEAVHPDVDVECNTITFKLVVVEQSDEDGCLMQSYVRSAGGTVVKVRTVGETVKVNGMPWEGSAIGYWYKGAAAGWAAKLKISDGDYVAGPLDLGFAADTNVNVAADGDLAIGSATLTIDGLVPDGFSTNFLVGVRADGTRYAKAIGAVDLAPLTPAVTVTVQSDEKAGPDSFQIRATNLSYGKLKFRDLCLSYTATAGDATTCSNPGVTGKFSESCSVGNAAWEGSADMVLPTAAAPTLDVFAGVDSTGFRYLGGLLSDLKNSKPISEDAFLDYIGGELCFNPARLAGTVGVRFGPAGMFNGQPFIDGRFGLVFDTGVLSATGTLSVLGQKAAGAWMTYTPPAAVDFGGYVKWDWSSSIGSASLGGTFSGFANTSHAQLEGNGSLCLNSVAGLPADVCETGEAVVSDRGAAGCVTVTLIPALGKIPATTVTAGAGYTWGGSLSIMAGSCGLGSWEVSRRAKIAQDDQHAFTVPEGPAAHAVRLVGPDGPPKVVLIGPDGRRIEPPTNRFHVQKGDYASFPSQSERSLSVLIARPASGNWRVELLGSERVTDVRTAEHTPEPVVVSEVRRDGDQHVLDYTAWLDGDRHAVEFYERGEGVHRRLGAVTDKTCPKRQRHPQHGPARCAVLRFRAASGPGGPRQIEAQAVDRVTGLPIGRRVVASIRVPERRPHRPRGVRVRRTSRGVVVTWRRTPNAVEHDVVLRSSHGHTILRVVRGRSVLFRGVSPHAHLRVTVRGHTADRRPGPATVRRLAARRPPHADGRRLPDLRHIG